MRRGAAWRGVDWQGKADEDWHGAAWRGKADVAWHGLAMSGTARHGPARTGKADMEIGVDAALLLRQLPAMTRAELVIQRDSAQSAYEKALHASEYSVGGGGANRSLKRQDLKVLRAEWDAWQKRIDIVDGTSRRMKFVMPRY